MTLVPLPALADNNIWMLKHGPAAIEVDPGDAQPTFENLGRGEPQLAAIPVTHRRADRAGSATIQLRWSDAGRDNHLFLRSRETTLLEAMHVRTGLSAAADAGGVFTALHHWKPDL